MQFLVLFRTSDITDTNSTRVQRALLLTARKLLDYRDRGKIRSDGLMNDRRSFQTYAVFDVESPQELDDLLRELPGLPFLDTKIHVTFPLEEAVDFLKSRFVIDGEVS